MLYLSATADTLDGGADVADAAAAAAPVAPLAVAPPPEGALARPADPDPPPFPLEEKYFSKGSFGFFFAVAPVALLDEVLGGATLLVLLATDTELGGCSVAL